MSAPAKPATTAVEALELALNVLDEFVMRFQDAEGRLPGTIFAAGHGPRRVSGVYCDRERFERAEIAAATARNVLEGYGSSPRGEAGR